MAKLNKLQVYAIRWLDSQGMNSEQISEELTLNKTQVKNTLEKHGTTKQEEVLKTVSEPVVEPFNPGKDLMIRHTAGKKTNNVAIMTGEASQVHDDARNRNRPNTSSTRSTEKNIFRPNNNK